MSDKQFDNLDMRFRQAAEQFDPPYDPADWQAMEKLLDGEGNKKRPFVWWWLVSDVFMLFLILVFMFYLRQDRKDGMLENRNRQAETTVTTNTGAKDHNGKTVVRTPIGAITPNTGNNGNKNLAPFTPKAGVFQSKNNPASMLSRGEIKGANTDANTPIGNKGTSSNHIAKPANTNLVTEGWHGLAIENKTSDRPSSNFDSSSMFEDTNHISEHLPNCKLNAEPDSNLQNTNVAPETSVVQLKPVVLIKHDSNDSVGEKIENKTEAPKGNFFVSATYGLEASWVKASPLGPWASMYGVMAGYQLNKWALRMGLFFTNKAYTGGSGIYKLPPGSYYQEITNFNAACRIMEIPLLISYRMMQWKKSKWQVSGGPITGIMQNEEYYYKYITNSGNTGYRFKNYETYNVDWFSGFRLSTSYEKLIGNKFSITAEPYLQLPLLGVGQGSVNLYSTGIQLSSMLYFGSIKKK